MWNPPKKLRKTIKSSFYGWVLCINRLYSTSNSTTKAKTNTIFKDGHMPKPDWWWDRNIFLSFWPSWVGSVWALLIETSGCKVGIKKSTWWLFYGIFRFENVSGLWCLSLWIIQVNYTMILQDWGNCIGTGVRDRFTSITFYF
jgi:hypothetical protein